MLDEQEYVLVTAEISFYKKVQTSVSDLVSYTTDAMSVSHGDKPFANLQPVSYTHLDVYKRQTWKTMILMYVFKASQRKLQMRSKPERNTFSSILRTHLYSRI